MKRYLYLSIVESINDPYIKTLRRQKSIVDEVLALNNTVVLILCKDQQHKEYCSCSYLNSELQVHDFNLDKPLLTHHRAFQSISVYLIPASHSPHFLFPYTPLNMASQNQAVAPQAMAAPQPRAGKKAEGTRARKFKCERCPHLEGWSNAGDKRQHDLSVHGEGEKAACPTCQRGYTDMSGLRKHRLVCKEKGPDEAVYYMCPWCHGTKEGSTNLRNDNLKRHANRCDGREGPQDKDARDALWKRQERMSKNDIAAKKLAYTEKHGDDMPPGVSRRHRAVRQSRVERTEEPASHADPQRQHVF